MLTIGESTEVLNGLFNLSSGNIKIGNNVSFGHNVSCLTGSHDIKKFGVERQGYPFSGNDIIIEDGVWIGSNVTILGPCKIGKNSAIAAMSLVNKINVPENCLYGGIPAKFIKPLVN
jgi:acetyltransferase-like isoleucine patch superfamily enzyme